MEVTANVDGAKAVLALDGKLTVQTSPELKDAVEALPVEVSDIVVDLADVAYIASAGLRVLVAIDKLASERGGRMRLVHPRDSVVEVLEMTGLSEVFVVER